MMAKKLFLAGSLSVAVFCLAGCTATWFCMATCHCYAGGAVSKILRHTVGHVFTQRGIKKTDMAWPMITNEAVAVVRIDRIKIIESRLAWHRWVHCYFTPLKTLRPGRGRPGRTLLDDESFTHLPDHWYSPVRELLKEGHVYLVVVDLAPKWPILEKCAEVSGKDDPLVRQVETWLFGSGTPTPGVETKEKNEQKKPVGE